MNACRTGRSRSGARSAPETLIVSSNQTVVVLAVGLDAPAIGQALDQVQPSRLSGRPGCGASRPSKRAPVRHHHAQPAAVAQHGQPRRSSSRRRRGGPLVTSLTRAGMSSSWRRPMRSRRPPSARGGRRPRGPPAMVALSSVVMDVSRVTALLFGIPRPGRRAMHQAADILARRERSAVDGLIPGSLVVFVARATPASRP
jgi:hypothetical protein